jgi:hypothetical protein
MRPSNARPLQTAIEPFKAARPPADAPRRLAIRRWSARGAAALTLVLVLALAATIALAAGVAVYDGPGIAFGVGGLHVGAGATQDGLVPLTAFSRDQRLVGALAVCVLLAPVVFMLYCGRALLACLAAGQIFSDRAAWLLRCLSVGVVLGAASPFAAHGLGLLAGVDRDPAELHPQQIMALAAAVLLLIFARVVKLGQDIERERDGFI